MENIIFSDNYVEELKNHKIKLVLIDKNVYENKHLDDNEFENIVIIDIDETTKDYKKYLEIINILDSYSINRSDIVALIGGGVLLDVASFACSTYKRGVKHINVPTTLLAMVDASIGGKCGVNHNDQKNTIGTFTQAELVIIDTGFLASLNKRFKNSAMSEVIKMALLSDCNNLLDDLINDDLTLNEIIKRANEIKNNHVKEDMNDLGIRRHLNLAHTYAHAIESYYDFNKYIHGEAVAIGLAIATKYDHEVIKLLRRYDLDTHLEADVDIEKLVNLMLNDKKNTSEQITYIDLPERYKAAVKEISSIEMIDKIKSLKPVKINNSKSLLHRQLIVSLIDMSKYQIEFDINEDLSNDILATIDVLKAYNIKFEISGNYLIVDSRSMENKDVIIDFRSSGTTLRVMIPILVKKFGTVKFTMSDQLKKRPIDELEKHFNLTKEKDYYTAGYIKCPKKIFVDGSISSQYISGFLYLAVLENNDIEIKITNEIKSLNYILMTIDVLRKVGVSINFDIPNKTIQISDCRDLQITNMNFKNEVDYSNIAFFLVNNKLADINKSNKYYIILNEITNSFQADRTIIDIINQNNHEVDMQNIPDLLPILMVYGALNKKGIILRNVERIKYKESNRIKVMIENFKKLNIKAVHNEKDDYVEVYPVTNIDSGIIKTYDDHRIAMSFAVLQNFTTKDIVIDNKNCVNKSFINFWKYI